MLSVTDPIQPALEHTRRILFRPFSWPKWFILGFAAFLAQLGGGGSFSYQGNPFGENSRSPVDFGPIRDWVAAHLPLVITLAILLFLVFLATAVLFQWLGSRGTFIFLDGVARDRAEIAEPWARLQGPGNELFRFRMILLMAGLGLLIVCGGLGVLIALPDLQAGRFGPSGLAGVGAGAGLLLLGVLGLTLIGLLLRDFVVPIMYRQGLSLPGAWAVLRNDLLPGHRWHFTGFYLMNLVLWIPAVILLTLGICCTCCLAALPYLSSVAFLPIFVFFRCYSLEFLAQFGEPWRVLPPAGSPE